MKRKNLKPMIISALLAVGFGATSVGTSFALFTDQADTSISVTSGIVDVENELTLVSYASSVDGTTKSFGEEEKEYTNSLVGSSFKLEDNGNVVINKMVPGDKLTVRLTSKNKSNVKTKTRYVLSHATTTGKKDLMPALTITFDAGDEMPASDLFKWKEHDAASSSSGDELYSLTATIEFVNHDDGIVANTEGRDNQYQDAACSIGLALESVQANAATSLIDDVNNYLSAQEIMEGKNATMHDAMADVDELNGTVTPKVYTLDLVKTDYAWGVNEDQFVVKTDITGNKYNYFAVYEEMPSTQDYSIYAAPTWSTSDVNIVVGFDAGDAQNISQVSYVRNGVNDAAQNVVIRTNSYSTVLTIDAEKDTVTHYGKANKVEIAAVDNNNCYNEHGDVAGNINLEKGKVVVHNDCSAGAVVIDMTAAQLATVTTLSADNSANKEVPIILNTSEVLWAANPNNDLINPTTNNIIYSSTGGTLPEGFDTMTDEQKEAAIATASEELVQGVAAIENAVYPTLQGAINAAQNGDKVVLLDNIAMASGTFLMVRKSITINMNEKTISGNTKNLIWVHTNDTGKGNLTIRGNGSIENQQAKLFNVSVHSALTIYDGNYSADADVMYVDSSIVNVYGGSFTVSNTTNLKTWEIVCLGNASIANIYGGNFTTPEGGCYGIALYNASEVNLGKLGVEGPTFNTWRPCVSTNGSATYAAIININSGTYKSNRTDSAPEDQNVIQLSNAKSELQTLNVYGGYFEQTSATNGSIFHVRYNGPININISGGTFKCLGSSLFTGFGSDSSGWPTEANISVNVTNNAITGTQTVLMYGSTRLPDRDFVVVE